MENSGIKVESHGSQLNCIACPSRAFDLSRVMVSSIQLEREICDEIPMSQKLNPC